MMQSQVISKLYNFLIFDLVNESFHYVGYIGYFHILQTVFLFEGIFYEQLLKV